MAYRHVKKNAKSYVANIKVDIESNVYFFIGNRALRILC